MAKINFERFNGIFERRRKNTDGAEIFGLDLNRFEQEEVERAAKSRQEKEGIGGTKMIPVEWTRRMVDKSAS